jgi:hypothetical protein
MMANPSPHKARMARKRKVKPGTLLDLQKLLWKALRTAEAILDRACTQADGEWERPEDLQLRAIHAIGQCAGQYSKLLEVGEFEARIAALEAAQQGGRK